MIKEEAKKLKPPGAVNVNSTKVAPEKHVEVFGESADVERLDSDRAYDSNKVARQMFAEIKESGKGAMMDRQGEMVWELDSANGFLSYTKMKYV